MYLGNLSDTDQLIARWVRAISLGLLAGLTVTGVWQFFFHEATSSWSRYQLGSDRFLPTSASTGIAEVHAAIADVTGLFALFVLGWLSARVLYRVSWFALGALLVVIVSLYTGTLVRYNATFEDGIVSGDSQGYGQFFVGSVDGAVSDQFELNRLSVVFWMLVHIASVPVLVGSAWLTLRKAELKRRGRKGQSQSWLDKLPKETAV